VTPEDLRKEAAAAEFMARVVSFQPDKAWLNAKAAELRHQADRLEERSWRPSPAQAAAGDSEGASRAPTGFGRLLRPSAQ
jgi:hypothetical protein